MKMLRTHTSFRFLAKTLIAFIFLMIVNGGNILAQCAMCRASVESTLSQGDIGIASKLNTGILYLFVVPYVAVAVVGYLWYKRSRENARKADVLRRRKRALLGID